MKKVLAAVGFLTIMLSCGKKFIENESEVKKAENVEQIRAFNAANNLGLTEHVSTGVFWKKTKEVATPKYATSDLSIHIAYSLKTLDGTVLLNITPADSNFFGINNVANVFQGFVIAINSLGEGEKGVFYLPSDLVFGGDPPSDFDLDPWEVTVLEMELIKFYDEPALIDLFITRRNLNKPEVTAKGVRIIRTDNRPLTGDLKTGDVVKVAYKGYFLTGTEFDKGEIEVAVGGGSVIPGFDDGIANMRVGEKATIIIPWSLGYGAAGTNSIPGYATLVFDLEIVSKK
jgi:FKBP-type peptidyl-prolyl cis-trans isomerase